MYADREDIRGGMVSLLNYHTNLVSNRLSNMKKTLSDVEALVKSTVGPASQEPLSLVTDGPDVPLFEDDVDDMSADSCSLSSDDSDSDYFSVITNPYR
jgi:hypothetical protein